MHYACAGHNVVDSPRNYFGNVKYSCDGTITSGQFIFWQYNKGYMFYLSNSKNTTYISKVDVSIAGNHICKYKNVSEQIRQEAQERKALEAERKKVEREESKYATEIEKLKEQLNSAKEEELNKLNVRILELQSQLSDVIVKKDEISNLANGKAGNVYIISNLGSFGENAFKVGMTRRLDPQERVNELRNASVPFKFDVHSFIFSDDAIGLERRFPSILIQQ